MRRRFAVAFVLCLSSLPLQSAPANGWSSFGVLPFRGGDVSILKTPSRYILYYSKNFGTGPGGDIHGRAFSTDLKSWSVDPNAVCATSGDYCAIGGTKSGVLPLLDGRFRMYFNPENGLGPSAKGLSSAISSDGITWTREAGVRFSPDPTSIYEQGAFTMLFASFVRLPDNSVRMYYAGQVVAGAPGTPAWYNAAPAFAFPTSVTLSAISTDEGLTWTREQGVRINPMVHGPVWQRTLPGVGVVNRFLNSDMTAVIVQENGRAITRLYSQSISDGPVSYVSEDGLTFTLEGQIPAVGGDPRAMVLPDGRVWLLTNSYPDSIMDTMVYGPQPVALKNGRAELSAVSNSGFVNAAPFRSALIGLSGTTSGPVTVEAVAADGACDAPCSFHPEYYEFTAVGTAAPLSLAVDYTGPEGYAVSHLIVHAKTPEVTAVGAIFCLKQVFGSADATAFCKAPTPDLPMNHLEFTFLAGTSAPSSQTSTILSLGGRGYPFTVTSSSPWLTVSPTSGTAPAPLQVTVNPAGLTAGAYSGILTITAEGTIERIKVTTVVASGPAIRAVRNAASGAAELAPNGFLTVYGSGFAPAPTVWNPSTELPTTLGGVSVKVDGKPGFLSYADAGQINVLAPPDSASGTVTVEVTTAAGTATADASMDAGAPGWFTYSVGSATWIAALFANTTTLVAPAGSLGSVPSRSARAGDFLSLYANGLGPTQPAPPVGAVLTTAYPLSDLSRVLVTISGKRVPVLFAGLVAAGLYQINVQAPSDLGTGDLPVSLMIDGRATQPGVTLNFQ